MWSAVVGAVVGAIALAWRGLPPDPARVSSLREIPAIEYFTSTRSCSEIEQARSHLEGLSRRYLYAIQVRQSEILQTTRTRGSTGTAATPATRDQVVEDLEQGIRDFAGTGEEPALTQALLMLLASDGAHERWVDVYLAFLYRRPTEELVGRVAGTAITSGRVAGRMEDVLTGLRHVAEIPLDFPAKRPVLSALSGATLATTQPSCPPTHHRDRRG
jgi:hypothetical protein